MNEPAQALEGALDAPGRATAWGMAGCLLLIPTAAWGMGWALAVTVFTALGGCYKGGH